MWAVVDGRGVGRTVGVHKMGAAAAAERGGGGAIANQWQAGPLMGGMGQGRAAWARGIAAGGAGC